MERRAIVYFTDMYQIVFIVSSKAFPTFTFLSRADMQPYFHYPINSSVCGLSSNLAKLDIAFYLSAIVFSMYKYHAIFKQNHIFSLGFYQYFQDKLTDRFGSNKIKETLVFFTPVTDNPSVTRVRKNVHEKL